MTQQRRYLSKVRLAVLGTIALAGLSSQATAITCAKTISLAEREDAVHGVQNVMGRYSHIMALKGEVGIRSLFALNTEGVSWKTPGGPVGIEAMRARFNRPVGEAVAPGILRIHSMLTPVVEIAADGKTAKGVWDSFGPDIGGPDKVGNWLWLKYAVDFTKENGEWKIWHLQLYPIFNTPYDKSITQSAKERREKGTPQLPPDSPFMKNAPKDLWVYDGVSAPRGPYIPEPYCTFDPAKAY